ncbi:hypothetical protein GCM10017673_46380 [Streptosporangium violaceochromogenes]|nr:hypothetical protein GCM10017673_46380 [Streptosporangium violaceochromogenes]
MSIHHHNHHPEPSDERPMGEVVKFPRRKASDAPALASAPAPLEGTVLPRPATPGMPGTVSLLVAVRGHVVRVRDSEHTAKVTRGVLGVAVMIGQGWHSWLIRAWDGLTLGVYRRQIRAAEAMGDRVLLAEWVERKQQVADRRHARLTALPRMALGLAKLGAGGLIGSGVLLLGTSTLVWATGAGEFLTVPKAAGAVLRWGFDAIAFASTPALVAAPVALLWAAWREGRRRGDTPAWLVADDVGGSDGREVIPDEGAILGALRHLGIAELNKAFKAGWRPRFVLGTGRDGKGWRTQLELPPGVTVDMINRRKAVLAHNLVRLPVEVWPTEPKKQPGVLDLWVADQGSLTGPVDPWPLLHEGTTDYFTGVPVGVDIRGTTILGRLSEANYAIAGMMGSGKSTLIITLLLGAMLDPLVDIDVFVMATNADYDPMQPRLRTLLTGPGDEIVTACLATLRDLYADLTVRGKALQEHGERAVNRRLAEKDERLRPRIVVVDECQALFMHPELGEEAADITVKLISAARKYGVTLIFATPEPSTSSLPRKVISVVSNKACFAIGDQQSNDAILGTGSYTAGISATSLEPKTADGPGDIGTAMARGFQAKPGLLRSYYVAKGAGVDEVTPVVQRAMKLREDAGIGTGKAAAVVEEPRDLLADLLGVISGTEPVPAAQALAALKAAHPAHRPYAALRDRMDLVHTLGRMGVTVPATKNRYPIDPVTLRARMVDLAAVGADADDRVG